MLLFSHTSTPRLRYIIEFISSKVFAQPLIITTQQDEFSQYNGPKINYSSEQISQQEFRISPHTLLFETGIRPQITDCFEFQGKKAFFATAGDMPFDIFACSFYLLSRYEEYLPHKKDVYGRYAHENSIAFKEGFLNIPLVDTWLENFRTSIAERYPEVELKENKFSFTPSYDIDIAYSYFGKGLLRNAGGLLRSVLSTDWSAIQERFNVILGNKNDPFDAYGWMDAIHSAYTVSPRYFFSVAETTGRYDKNISPRNHRMRELLIRHSEKYQVGLHPSWRSGVRTSILRKEKLLLEGLVQKPVTASRQHYIRFSLPETFRQLLAVGINEDFSMGYGSTNGFRASVTTPFNWYDLEAEQQTGLILYPFCFMDANAFFEQKLSSSQALEELRYYHKVIKSVNGHMITVWHNTFLGTDKMFAGWREVYSIWMSEVGSR